MHSKVGSADDTTSASQASKKRQRTSQSDEGTGIINVPADVNRPSRVVNKPVSATHEIRQLRDQVAAMENELNQLQSKWTEQLPDTSTRATAQHSAREKYEVGQTEEKHNKLQDIQVEQQFMFASLQTAILHAPLHSSGKEMLKALHFNTSLGRDPEQREKVLLAHNNRSLSTIPSIVKKITQEAMDKVLAQRGKEDASKPVIPLSQIDVTGGKNSSIVSSVFISEIPNATLEEVYEAVASYFQDLPTYMKRHFSIDVKRERLNRANSPVGYWRWALDGNGIPARVNIVLCSELTASHGMFHVDVITDDQLYHVSSVQFGICGVTITPQRDPLTGEILSVTLRWLVLYHYNLVPNDPALARELEIIRPILNGDLITSSVCEYLQKKQLSSFRN
ncbi:hypothetical protein PPTG_17271 [Phytophthora nicotianae INRA-310]|uniref:Uncharacterized protein n=1 Tax=Phytophthora nicotianae (strain INRA-310) TaxID=761204 RepID=W2PLP2_PHYN3|nr:hypothetical protein PPTG_17271 [Phytophthora nicotianae INRA-310]ETN00945.1 hypothetical protein PPTG_17271 [Phytophthora nicotianae INRA-310]